MLDELKRDSRDHGSALVSVLIVMLVLSIGGLVLASIVTNTSGIVVDSRSKAQSRAAADAGLAEIAAQLDRRDLSCPATGTTATGTGVSVDGPGSPTYDYEVSCASGFATIRVNAVMGGARTAVQATYAHTPDAPTGGDMVFFGTGNVTFTYEVQTSAAGRPLDIIVPKASFTCQAYIPGNITAKGNIDANGGCTITGDVTSNGKLTMCCGGDTIEGDVVTAGTGTSVVRGTILGDFHAAGSVEFGWENKKVGGSVTTSGDAKLGNVDILGSLTLPSGRTLTPQSGTVIGGVFTPPSVPAPTPAVLPEWFEYKFDASDWPGYTVVPLSASGSGPGTCTSFNSHPASGWTTLGTYSAPVVIDARACGTLSSNSGTSPVIALKTNVVLLAKKFDLTTLTVKAAAGVAGKPNLWVMTEDVNPADGVPTCGSGYGDLLINGTVTDVTIKAMAYSPCRINVAGGAGGIHDSWNGTFYGGGWNYGGGLTFTADPIGVPGMDTGGGGTTASEGLGALISLRDVAFVPIAGGAG